MKKIILTLCTCLFLLSLGGCSASVETKAEETVTSFLTNLEEGKLEEAYTYVEEDADTAFSSFQKQKQSITEYFTTNSADEETLDVINQIFSDLLKSFTKEHKITEVTKVSDEEATVKVTLTIADPDAISDKMVDIDISGFMSEIASDALEVYTSDGEEAANTFVMSKLASWLQTTYTDALTGIGTIEENTTFTVKKVDDKWLISNMEVE